MEVEPAGSTSCSSPRRLSLRCTLPAPWRRGPPQAPPQPPTPRTHSQRCASLAVRSARRGRRGQRDGLPHGARCRLHDRMPLPRCPAAVHLHRSQGQLPWRRLPRADLPQPQLDRAAHRPGPGHQGPAADAHAASCRTCIVAHPLTERRCAAELARRRPCRSTTSPWMASPRQASARPASTCSSSPPPSRSIWTPQSPPASPPALPQPARCPHWRSPRSAGAARACAARVTCRPASSLS